MDEATLGVTGLFGEPQFVDLSDPLAPQSLNFFWSPGDGPDPAWGVAVRGDMAMLTYFDGGLAFVDLRTAVGMQVVASIGLEGRSPGAIDFRDGLAVFAGGGITTIDASMPERGEVLASTVQLSIDSYRVGTPVAATDHLGFVFTSEFDTLTVAANWLHILDTSSDGTPIELSRVLLPSPGRAILLDGHYGYVTTAATPLMIIDFSEPASPVVVGRIETLPASPGILDQVAMDAGYMYVADGLAGWQVLDVRDVTNPVFVTRIPAGFASAVAVGVSEGVLCLAEDWIELRVFDVTNPAAPVQTAVVDLHDRPGGIVIRDGVAFVAAGLLRTIDVSNPTNPVVLDVLDAPSTGAGPLVLDGDHAYIPSLGGLSVVEISDPTDLVFAARWRIPNAAGLDDPARGVAAVASASGRLLATRAQEGGDVYLLDASDCVCPADLTGDGVADSADIAVFIGAFQVGGDAADLNEDGFVNFGDVSEFIAAYTAGCGV
jgi:hypothetical protein